MRDRHLLMTERDIQRTPWSIPILWAAWIAVVLGFMLSHVIQMDTYYPERFTFVWWTEMLVFFSRLVLIFAMLFRLVNYTNPWAINFGFLFTIIFILMECCVIAAKIILMPSLNKSPLDSEHTGTSLNVGNDPLYCCVFGNETLSECFFSNTSSTCIDVAMSRNQPLGLTENDLNVTVEFKIAFYLAIIMGILGVIMFLLSMFAKRTLYAIRTYTDADGNTVRKEMVELDNIGGKQQQEEGPFRRHKTNGGIFAESDHDDSDRQQNMTHEHFY